MSSQIPKRISRSDKFPLTLHPTGQYCKKIRGKVYYFGVDKHEALNYRPKNVICTSRQNKR
jgi:hypothetical protein